VEKEDDEVSKLHGEDRKTVDENRSEDNAPVPVPQEHVKEEREQREDRESGDSIASKGIKREHANSASPHASPPRKAQKTRGKTRHQPSSVGDEALPGVSTRKTRSATSNGTAVASPSPVKGSRKITSFFGK
jgi:hypothetical protein